MARRDKIKPCRRCGVLREVSGRKNDTSTGLCRKCFNTTMPRGEGYRQKMAEATRRVYSDPVHRAAQSVRLRERMARMTPEERERRRERGRLLGLSKASAQAHPAGSPARKAAGLAAAETKRRKRNGSSKRKSTFQEQLQAVLEGRAIVTTKPTLRCDPEMTLGGVSAGWMG